MIKHELNDNSSTNVHTAAARSDSRGHAALLLVESLIHGLVARSVIDVANAIEIVEVAAAVKEMTAIDRGEPAEALRESLLLLAAISTSLSADLPPQTRSNGGPRHA